MIDEVIARPAASTGAEEFVKCSCRQARRGARLGSLDEIRNPVQNIYIKKVEKKKMFGYHNEELWNTVIKTYPNVGQFWTYGKETFLQTAGLQPGLTRPVSTANSQSAPGLAPGPAISSNQRNPT